VAVFLYAGMMANLDETHNPNSDAMGRGLAAGFAVVFLIAEWLVLAVLLMIGGVKGEMPAWSAMTGTILLPLSRLFRGFCAGAFDNGTDARYILVPALIPPVIAATHVGALDDPASNLAALPTSLVAGSQSRSWRQLRCRDIPRSKPHGPLPPRRRNLPCSNSTTRKSRFAWKWPTAFTSSPGLAAMEWDNFFDDPDFGKQAIRSGAAADTSSSRCRKQELDMGIGRH